MTTQEVRRNEAEELNLRLPHSSFSKAGLEPATPHSNPSLLLPVLLYSLPSPHHWQPCVNNPCVSCVQGCSFGGVVNGTRSSSEVSSSNLSGASE